VVHLIPNGFLTSRNSNFFLVEIVSINIFFRGKVNRRDVHQAPYVWVQFTNVTENVLIHVICRVFAKNINFERQISRARGLTRFQIFIKDNNSKQ
jgi:hypothetical protein